MCVLWENRLAITFYQVIYTVTASTHLWNVMLLALMALEDLFFKNKCTAVRMLLLQDSPYAIWRLPSIENCGRVFSTHSPHWQNDNFMVLITLPSTNQSNYSAGPEASAATVFLLSYTNMNIEIRNRFFANFIWAIDTQFCFTIVITKNKQSEIQKFYGKIKRAYN